MIVLDTNVLSELMRKAPDDGVVRWLDDQAASLVWTTTITVFEIRYGLELIAEEPRRRALETAFDAVLADDLGGRILNFDSEAANETARICAEGRRSGRSVDLRDAMIAGTVATRDATLATRNERHFEATGVAWVNPWQVGA